MKLTIGQLANRTGTTPRALRLYEHRGLLRADRTGSGRRVYGAEHLTILVQIRTFKGLGLSLDAIACIMRARTLDAGELIDLRLAQIETEQARFAAMHAKLRAARAALSAGPVDAARLCELLSDPAPADFRKLLDRWFTPSEQAEWRMAAASAKTTDSWDRLHARVHRAIAAGIAPESAAGAALATQWRKMMRQMVDAVGEKQWNKGAALAQNAFSGAGTNAQPEAAAAYAWLSTAVRNLMATDN
jgi:DNA-binding transcriptional MerR regulator